MNLLTMNCVRLDWELQWDWIEARWISLHWRALNCFG